MTVTFPHMGKVYISAKALFEDLGVDVVVPPPITKKTLELGTKYSPELACLPLKITLGNYIESIQKGADTIVIVGSMGPCRFGYYGVVQDEILKTLGLDANVVIFDPPEGDFKDICDKAQKISGNKPWFDKMKASYKALKIVMECDKIYELANIKRPREMIPGQTDKEIHEFEKTINDNHGSDSTLEIIGYYKKVIRNIKERHDYIPIRIGLVGEIYTLIEPFVNVNIEKKLGELGVEVDKSLTISSWVKDHMYVNVWHRVKEKNILKKGSTYLNLCVGGHAWQTIANSVHYSEIGFDGVIQIMPFGCMPEVVAQSILPTIADDRDIPIMTLAVDEMTGSGGYYTRLEAFVDLIKERSRRGYVKRKSVFRD